MTRTPFREQLDKNGQVVWFGAHWNMWKLSGS